MVKNEKKKAEKQKKKIEILDDVFASMDVVQKISHDLKDDNYVSAAIETELLPEEINKDPIYAAFILRLTHSLDKTESTQAKKEYEHLINHYKNLCSFYEKD